MDDEHLMHIDTRPLLSISRKQDTNVEKVLLQAVTARLQQFQSQKRSKLPDHWKARVIEFLKSSDLEDYCIVPVMTELELNEEFVTQMNLFHLHPLVRLFGK